MAKGKKWRRLAKTYFIYFCRKSDIAAFNEKACSFHWVKKRFKLQRNGL